MMNIKDEDEDARAFTNYVVKGKITAFGVNSVATLSVVDK